MSAFDGLVRVRPRVITASADSTLPNPSLLSWTGIAESAALANTAGADCELVHEDRWQRTNGQHIENIAGSQRHTVQGDQTIIVDGKHKETIVGECLQNVIGPHLVANHADRHETRMARCTLTYGSFFVDDNPPSGGGGRWTYANVFMSYALLLNHEIDVSKVDLHGVHVEGVPGFHLESKGIHTECGLYNNGDAVYKDETAADKDEAAALKTAVSAMNSEVGIINADLHVLNEKIRAVDQETRALRLTADVYINSGTEFGTFIMAP